MQHAYVDIRANWLEAVLDREVNVRKRLHEYKFNKIAIYF